MSTSRFLLRQQVKKLSPKKFLFLFLLVLFVCAPTKGQTNKVVTAKQANGTYRYRSNEIKILALGNNKLKVQLDLIHPFKSPSGPMAHTGFALGIADIEGNIATFTPPDTQGCTITMKFLPGGKLSVKQESTDSDCGFGHNVFADGTYTKRSSAKPKFDEDR